MGNEHAQRNGDVEQLRTERLIDAIDRAINRIRASDEPSRQHMLENLAAARESLSAKQEPPSQ
jgi:hypothetical protein